VFCPTCGTAVSGDGAFCSSCGARLGTTGSDAVAQDAPAAAPDPVAAPVYAPPMVAAPGPATPPKKKRGCLIALAIVLGLTACCIAVPALAYFGALSLGKPRDLGVRYTEKDYRSATAKLGIDTSQADPATSTAAAGESVDGGVTGDAVSGDAGTGATADAGAGGTAGGAAKPTTPPKTTKHSAPVTQGPAKGTMVVYEGSRPIDIFLTSEEFSALMSMHHYSPNWLVQDLQVRFGDNGQMELSGYVTWEGRLYGGYASAIGELTGPQSVGGSITKLEGLGVEVPAEWNGPAGDYLAGVMNDWLAQMEGLNLQEATVTGGQLHIVGTVPARVVRVPADTP
jgi:hypothetical protein